MSFLEAVSSALRNFKVYTGRSGRAEYWYWFLFVFIANMLLSIPTVMMAMITDEPALLAPFYLAQLTIAIFLLLPTIAVTIRRLHDTNLSGWYMLLFFLPAVGGIINIIMMVQPGTPGGNRYGV